MWVFHSERDSLTLSFTLAVFLSFSLIFLYGKTWCGGWVHVNSKANQSYLCDIFQQFHRFKIMTFIFWLYLLDANRRIQPKNKWNQFAWNKCCVESTVKHLKAQANDNNSKNGRRNIHLKVMEITFVSACALILLVVFFFLHFGST